MMDVLTERARSGLDYFVSQAMQSALTHGERCNVSPIDEASIVAPSVVMLTVSSYTFRVLMFVHFDESRALRDYIGKLVGKSIEELVGDRFHDAVMERGNLLCGAVNRDLAAFFPHIGMSTPCVLTRNAVQQLASVNPAYVQRLRAEFGAGCNLFVTYAVCASSQFDFPFDSRGAVAAAAESAGELEMF